MATITTVTNHLDGDNGSTTYLPTTDQHPTPTTTKNTYLADVHGNRPVDRHLLRLEPLLLAESDHAVNLRELPALGTPHDTDGNPRFLAAGAFQLAHHHTLQPLAHLHI